MTHANPRNRFWPPIFLLVALMLVWGSPASAEDRLPANRTYFAYIHGLEENPFLGQFGCIVFHRNGTVAAGDDTGQWFIVNRLSPSPHQRTISIGFDFVDEAQTPPLRIRMDGLCWLEDMGPTNSLSCSMYARGGELELNFAVTGKPLGGETSAETLARCQARADEFNQRLGVE